MLTHFLYISDYGQQKGHSKKQSNNLPINGNESTMNLNPLILTNIQSSSYFKVTLFKLKTYHEVIDEIYYQVKHLEPWERGSRKTSGQTGLINVTRFILIIVLIQYIYVFQECVEGWVIFQIRKLNLLA